MWAADRWSDPITAGMSSRTNLEHLDAAVWRRQSESETPSAPLELTSAFAGAKLAFQAPR